MIQKKKEKPKKPTKTNHQNDGKKNQLKLNDQTLIQKQSKVYDHQESLTTKSYVFCDLNPKIQSKT